MSDRLSPETEQTPQAGTLRRGGPGGETRMRGPAGRRVITALRRGPRQGKRARLQK